MKRPVLFFLLSFAYGWIMLGLGDMIFVNPGVFGLADLRRGADLRLLLMQAGVVAVVAYVGKTLYDTSSYRPKGLQFMNYVILAAVAVLVMMVVRGGSAVIFGDNPGFERNMEVSTFIILPVVIFGHHVVGKVFRPEAPQVRGLSLNH